MSTATRHYYIVRDSAEARRTAASCALRGTFDRVFLITSDMLVSERTDVIAAFRACTQRCALVTAVLAVSDMPYDVGPVHVIGVNTMPARSSLEPAWPTTARDEASIEQARSRAQLVPQPAELPQAVLDTVLTVVGNHRFAMHDAVSKELLRCVPNATEADARWLAATTVGVLLAFDARDRDNLSPEGRAVANYIASAARARLTEAEAANDADARNNLAQLLRGGQPHG